MDNREAIEFLKNVNIAPDLESIVKCSEIINMAIEALEKQIPKKPKPICIDYGVEPVVVSYNCTACGLEVGVNYADGHKIREHHCHCGQRINWSDEDGN